MTETPSTLLEKSWCEQANYLRRLPRKELEILWLLMQEHGEAFDRLRLAVFSILRDLGEAQETRCAEVYFAEPKQA